MAQVHCEKFKHSFSCRVKQLYKKKRERKDKVNSPLGTLVKSSKLKMATTSLYPQKFIPVFPAIQPYSSTAQDFIRCRTSLLNSISRRGFILELITLARKLAKRAKHHTENIQINLNSKSKSYIHHRLN